MPLFANTVGIDLGLKDFAATIDGQVVEARKFYRALEADLATAQRANQKKPVKNFHAGMVHREQAQLAVEFS